MAIDHIALIMVGVAGMALGIYALREAKVYKKNQQNKKHLYQKRRRT